MSAWYELHITVEHYPSLSQVIDFGRQCREDWIAKCHLIQLANGRYPMQLMLAQKQELKNDSVALEWGSETMRTVVRAGWSVVRYKVEAELKKGDAVYWEAHWKFVLKADQDLYAFNHFRETTPGFLSSKNHLQDDVYYLSQRSYQPESKVARKQFNAATRQIEMAALPLEKAHYERVLLDTFPGLDEGWDK